MDNLSRTKLFAPEAELDSQGEGLTYQGFSISSVERDTGIPKETLRVWERRYGFPAPGRDAKADRLYSAEDLEKLRIARRLINAGFRPGKILGLDLQDLAALNASSAPFASEEVRRGLELLTSARADRFESWLATSLARDGLKAFVVYTAPDITAAVGEAWARGELEIHHEHLFTEILTRIIRVAVAGTTVGGHSPRVLLTTFPHEPHAIGLLFAEAMMAISGCKCLSLGTETPIPEIAVAAAAHEIDIVGLSFSKAQTANRITEGLTDLRAQLPDRIAIWAGGSAEALGRASDLGITVMQDLQKISDAVDAWRRANQST